MNLLWNLYILQAMGVFTLVVWIWIESKAVQATDQSLEIIKSQNKKRWDEPTKKRWETLIIQFAERFGRFDVTPTPSRIYRPQAIDGFEADRRAMKLAEFARDLDTPEAFDFFVGVFAKWYNTLDDETIYQWTCEQMRSPLDRTIWDSKACRYFFMNIATRPFEEMSKIVQGIPGDG